MRLIIPGNDLIATFKCRSFEEAMTRSAAALEKQIVKRKTILEGRLKRNFTSKY